MKKRIVIIGLFLLAFITGCSRSTGETEVPTQNSQPEIQLKADAKLGLVLTDKTGRTLYFFANDSNGSNTCTGGCEAVWPIFNVENLTAQALGKDLDIEDFKTTTTVSGKKQITYKGYPLYYFAPNGGAQEAPGETKGEGAGNVWFVAKPDYTIMLANAQLVGNNGKNYTSNYTEGTGRTSYFTNSKGLTLYTFTNDRKNKNNWTLADFSNDNVWPIYEEDKIVVPSSLDKSLFGSITVHGKKQLTYKGWPLYYFGGDNKERGSNKGVTVPNNRPPGSVWPVAVKDVALAVD
ncbi:hypothetical protein IQ37_17075 [Chryseobacterium piperi]|uniref:Lipoprotein n=1 Tax=Chryseobacterium piperi TaxID=558152 RepID=A0A086ALD1_9FLAO|nr:hypothetical protein [Chryseobacterium piperi]ASW73557.1 hypothetical protein CJF12_04135 [Chryseobacterium piperi]KFF17495.1 hypothetical protein IQ37_17075 [Chryseobacterium piperi]